MIYERVTMLSTHVQVTVNLHLRGMTTFSLQTINFYRRNKSLKERIPHWKIACFWRQVTRQWKQPVREVNDRDH